MGSHRGDPDGLLEWLTQRGSILNQRQGSVLRHTGVIPAPNYKKTRHVTRLPITSCQT